jgi:CheY-like chemotaxis protein
VLIEETMDLFSRNLVSTFQLCADIKDDTWNIDGDAGQIQQVLINLFENSLHATEGAGTLHLTARNFVLFDRAMSEAFECDPGHYVIITIADDGHGMSETIRERVFEPFFTTKKPGMGTGLGLANARSIVRQHQGHITCTSTEEQGTAFSLYLPRHRAGKTFAHRREAGQGITEKNTPGVLVVEDEALLRNLVISLCEKNGYRTFGAADGLEALEFITENPDEIFAIVLDLAMPRMTGTELFRRLNEEGIHLPVIVASGFLVDRDKFIEETGGAPYAIFSKPYQLAELITKVHELRDLAGVVIAS